MRGRRQVVPLVLTVLCVLGVLGATRVATGSTLPALALQQTGHWVLNKALGTVLHVDGGTRQVDAQVSLPADAARDGMLTVQGATEGYVVGRDRVWVFDKSTLRVVDTQPSAAPEVPIAIEVVGGPYLVYRQAGTVVRLGRPPAVGHAGGPLGAPVRTEDGTVWVQRTGDGTVCAFRAGAVELDCSVPARAVPGGLTVTHDTATLVDTGADAAQLVANRALASSVPLGADLSDKALLGDRSTGDVLPVVDPVGARLTLVDCRGLPMGRPSGPPTQIGLGPGTFSAPVVSGGVIVVLELTTSRLFTFTPVGTRLSVTQLPAGTDASAIRTGEDGRIYVDEPGGGSTRIVQEDGSVATVPLGTEPGGKIAVAPPTEQQKPVTPPQPGRVVPIPVPKPVPNPVQPPPVQPPVVQPPVVQPPVVQPPVVQPPPVPPVVPPVVAAPSTPTGVTAALAGADKATVTWQASDGHGLTVQYVVAVTGGPGTVAVTGATATVSGLAAATTYTFTVAARSSAGTSPASAPSEAITTAADVAPPTGLTARRSNQSGSLFVDVRWNAPGAGAVASYEVSVHGQLGDKVKTVTTTSYLDGSDGGDNYCATTVTYSVRSVDADGRRSTPATLVLDTPVDCTITPTITSAVPNADGSVALQVACGPQGHGPLQPSPIVISFNGAVKDPGSRRCTETDGEQPQNYVITGLAPGTTYAITARTTSSTGTKTSNRVSVTTAG